MDTEEKIAELRAIWVRSAGGRFDHIMNEWCESPIERLFLAYGYSAMEWGNPSQGETYDIYSTFGAKFGKHQFRALISRTPLAFLAVQVPISLEDRDVRADFILHTYGHWYAIELDGHDFHERTKEQAQRDKSRDRLLTAIGIPVLRFTGSEIYRDPFTCWNEIMKLIGKHEDEDFELRLSAERLDGNGFSR